MFLLYAIKNQLSVRKREQVTSGSVNAYQVKFDFSSEWDGLRRIAVFQAGGTEKSVELDGAGICSVPWEVLVEPGWKLMAGVHGFRGDKLVLPTEWADLGTIKEGAVNCSPLFPPTPELWHKALSQKGDALGYTKDGKLGLWSGNKLLDSVSIKGGDEEDNGPVATDKEVNDMLDDVFG